MSPQDNLVSLLGCHDQHWLISLVPCLPWCGQGPIHPPALGGWWLWDFSRCVLQTTVFNNH